MCMSGSSTLLGSCALDHLKGLLLCLCLLPVYQAMGSSDCTHYYLSQPVREIPCDPYHPLNAELSLECNTFGRGNYSVYWFHSVTLERDTVTQQLANRQNGVFIDTDVDDDFQHSQLHIDVLRRGINIGFYWCQIGLLQIDNQSIVTVNFLEPSQRTLVLPLENYTGLPPCSTDGELDESIVRCATDPPPSDVQIPAPSEIPDWSYFLIAALAVALIIIVILLLAHLVACRRSKKTKNGLSTSYQPEIEATENTHQTSQFTPSPQPPTIVPSPDEQVSSHTFAPLSGQQQTLHVVPPPTDEELTDRCSVTYDEAGNESTRPSDMVYRSLDQHSMDDPTIYTPATKYQQLDLQSIDEAHSYSSIQ